MVSEWQGLGRCMGLAVSAFKLPLQLDHQRWQQEHARRKQAQPQAASEAAVLPA